MCKECKYFLKYRTSCGIKEELFGVCDNKKSDHHQHVLTIRHSGCKEFCVNPEDKHARFLS
jgi:hypothetical protein